MCFRHKETFSCGCVVLSDPVWCDYARSIGRQCANVALQEGDGSVYNFPCRECRPPDNGDDDDGDDDDGEEETDDEDEDE